MTNANDRHQATIGRLVKERDTARDEVAKLTAERDQLTEVVRLTSIDAFNEAADAAELREMLTAATDTAIQRGKAIDRVHELIDPASEMAVAWAFDGERAFAESDIRAALEDADGG